MPAYGYTLFSELNGPVAMADQAVAAEAAGFDFLGMSDHFHPWLSRHSDSPFAWSVLGAVADRTESVDLITLVTCPFLRYHPAIVAQAAATIGLLSGDRFVLGLGAGENLSEHVVGRGWPPVDVRHEMLGEAVDIIRALFTGEWVTYRGTHLTVEDARLHSLPDHPPEIALAASAGQSLRVAIEHADHVVCDQPDPDVAGGFKASASGEAICQLPIAYDPADEVALDAAHHFAFGATGWKVMAELPNIPGFDAAAGLVRDDDITQLVPTGSDGSKVSDLISQAVDAGYDRVSVVQVGPDRGEGFFAWWNEQVRPGLP